jgi:hypothetical protein
VEAAGSSRWAAVGVIAGSAGEPVSLRGANGLGAVQRGDPSEVEIRRRAGRRWGRGQCEGTQFFHNGLDVLGLSNDQRCSKIRARPFCTINLDIVYFLSNIAANMYMSTSFYPHPFLS